VAPGVGAVWRWEVAKLRQQVRTKVALGACAVAPFAVVAVVASQSSTPQDTPFGRWVHESGFAVPLVILNFAGMWLLPLLTAVVAGDIFSSEDHFGTWKTILTRSVGRGPVFVGKVAAAAAWAVAVVVVLAMSSLVAGLVIGHQPLVGLSGQLVPAGSATGLVLASWGTTLLPELAFTALAVLMSVLSRSSPVGMGGPVLLGLVMQLLALVNSPEPLRMSLLVTPLLSWHGFWTSPGFTGPFIDGVVVSVAWVVVCLGGAWLAFRRRTIEVG